jgi:hypothetical protein
MGKREAEYSLGYFDRERTLHFVALEELVLFTAGTVRALQTANQEYRDSNRDYDGQNARVDHEPVIKASHDARPSLNKCSTNSTVTRLPNEIDRPTPRPVY